MQLTEKELRNLKREGLEILALVNGNDSMWRSIMGAVDMALASLALPTASNGEGEYEGTAEDAFLYLGLISCDLGLDRLFPDAIVAASPEACFEGVKAILAKLDAAQARVKELEATLDNALKYREMGFPEFQAQAVPADGVRGALNWALTYIADGTHPDDGELPEHDCGYMNAPDTGYCKFHKEYFKAWEILALSPKPSDEGVSRG